MNGLMHRSKQHLYSITSLERAINLSGNGYGWIRTRRCAE
jgi:hypothetical protein